MAGLVSVYTGTDRTPRVRLYRNRNEAIQSLLAIASDLADDEWSGDPLRGNLTVGTTTYVVRETGDVDEMKRAKSGGPAYRQARTRPID